MGNLTLARFGLLMISITLGSFGQICLKNGLSQRPIQVVPGFVNTLSSIASSVMNPWVLAGLGLYVISVFTWIMLISRVRLSVVYPMISISYIMVMLLSVWLLHEVVVWKYAVWGLAFIGVGVTFIGFGMGQDKGTGK